MFDPQVETLARARAVERQEGQGTAARVRVWELRPGLSGRQPVTTHLPAPDAFGTRLDLDPSDTAIGEGSGGRDGAGDVGPDLIAHPAKPSAISESSHVIQGSVQPQPGPQGVVGVVRETDPDRGAAPRGQGRVDLGKRGAQ